MFTRLCVLAVAAFLTAGPAMADPKPKPDKGRDKWEKWDEKRWKEEKKAREKAADRAEKAWEHDRKDEVKQLRKWSERNQPSYRYYYQDFDDEGFGEGYSIPRYEYRRPVYPADGYYRDGPTPYQAPPPPQFYRESYYPGRGAIQGGRIGARIGELIGGPDGARIGADIGAEIGDEVDR